MNRDAEAQIRPETRVLASAARTPTLSGSTPAPMITGALPPSSISTGFMARAASSLQPRRDLLHCARRHHRLQPWLVPRPVCLGPQLPLTPLTDNPTGSPPRPGGGWG